jgi:hypothetical protein
MKLINLFEDKSKTIRNLNVLDALFESDSLNTMREIIKILTEEGIKITNSREIILKIKSFENEQYYKREKNFFEDQNDILFKIDGVDEYLSLRFIQFGKNLKVKIKFDHYGLEKSKPIDIRNTTLEQFVKFISIFIKELIEERKDYKLRYSRKSKWYELEPDKVETGKFLDKIKKISSRFLYNIRYSSLRVNSLSFDIMPVEEIFKEKFLIAEQLDVLKKLTNEIITYLERNRYYLNHVNPSNDRLYLSFRFSSSKKDVEEKIKIIDGFISDTKTKVESSKYDIMKNIFEGKKK